MSHRFLRPENVPLYPPESDREFLLSRGQLAGNPPSCQLPAEFHRNFNCIIRGAATLSAAILSLQKLQRVWTCVPRPLPPPAPRQISCATGEVAEMRARPFQLLTVIYFFIATPLVYTNHNLSTVSVPPLLTSDSSYLRYLCFCIPAWENTGFCP